MCSVLVVIDILVKQLTGIVCHYMDIIFNTPHKIFVKLSCITNRQIQ